MWEVKRERECKHNKQMEIEPWSLSLSHCVCVFRPNIDTTHTSYFKGIGHSNEMKCKSGRNISVLLFLSDNKQNSNDGPRIQISNNFISEALPIAFIIIVSKNINVRHYNKYERCSSNLNFKHLFGITNNSTH